MQGGEKMMYPKVSRMFEDLGYSTIEDKLTIEPYPGFRRRIDVVAYRWKKEELETIAVECKDEPPPRGIAEGISQAITYLLYFDDVYIATSSGTDLSVLNVLRQLGIGYIMVDDDVSSIVSQADPRRLSLLDYEKSLRHVRSRLKALSIFGCYVAPETFRYGGLIKQDEFWSARDIVGELQHNLWLNEMNDKFRSGLNLEHKPTAGRIFEKMGPKDTRQLAQLIGDLPDTYQVMLKQTRKVPKGSEPVFQEEPIVDGKRTARRLTREVRIILKRRQWRPEISINRPVWSVMEDITLDEGEKRLQEVRSELTPLIEFLGDLYKK
ncbi:MAG: hypothetical protein KAW09_00855 [Thermoplasmata archaeon]|nr:hypothetical protein [Thermoplasmata archaeon]